MKLTWATWRTNKHMQVEYLNRNLFLKFEKLKIRGNGISGFASKRSLCLVYRQPSSVYTSITLVLCVSRAAFCVHQHHPGSLCVQIFSSQGDTIQIGSGSTPNSLFYLNYLFKDLFPNIVLTSAYKSKDDSGYHRVKKCFSFNRQEHIFKAKHGWWHISIISLLRKQAEGWRFEGYPVLHNITSSFKTAF